jgi:hypothetical protein
VEAYREPAFGVGRAAVPTEQRDRFRPPELTLGSSLPKGELGSQFWAFDHLRVSA